MPTDPDTITLSEIVRRAAAIVDPPGEDAAVEEFAVRYEDADQPVRGMLDGLQERILWGADEDAPIVMAQAVTLYLAHRPEDLENTPEHILLHARAPSSTVTRRRTSRRGWPTRACTCNSSALRARKRHGREEPCGIGPVRAGVRVVLAERPSGR